MKRADIQISQLNSQGSNLDAKVDQESPKINLFQKKQLHYSSFSTQQGFGKKNSIKNQQKYHKFDERVDPTKEGSYISQKESFLNIKPQSPKQQNFPKLNMNVRQKSQGQCKRHHDLKSIEQQPFKVTKLLQEKKENHKTHRSTKLFGNQLTTNFHMQAHTIGRNFKKEKVVDSVFTKAQISLKQYNNTQYKQMMSSLYKDTLDHTKKGVENVRSSNQKLSQLNFHQIIESEYLKTDPNQRYDNLNSSLSEEKLFHSQESMTVKSSQKYEITDNYFVAQKNKESEKKAIYSATHYQMGLKQSMEQSSQADKTTDIQNEFNSKYNQTQAHFDQSKLTKSSGDDSAFQKHFNTYGTDESTIQKSTQSVIEIKKSNQGTTRNMYMVLPQAANQYTSRNLNMTPVINVKKTSEINLLNVSKSKLESSLFKKYSTSSILQDNNDGANEWNPYGKKKSSVDQRIALFAKKNQQRLNSVSQVHVSNLYQTNSQTQMKESQDVKNDEYQQSQTFVRKSQEKIDKDTNSKSSKLMKSEGGQKSKSHSKTQSNFNKGANGKECLSKKNLQKLQKSKQFAKLDSKQEYSNQIQTKNSINQDLKTKSVDSQKGHAYYSIKNGKNMKKYERSTHALQSQIGQSSQTWHQNLKADSTLYGLQKVENQKDMELQREIEKSEGSNLQIALIQKQMSSIKFNLNHSLVCTDDQKYLLFMESPSGSKENLMQRVVEVVQDNINVYCKVQVPEQVLKRGAAEIKFKISNTNRTHLTDIGVYISSIINQPSEDNCQQYFLNQSRFKFSCQNPSQYIYFTIKSQNGCQIKISLFFVGHSHSINPKDINEERLKHDITAQLFTKYYPGSDLVSTALRSKHEIEKLDEKICQDLDIYHAKEFAKQNRFIREAPNYVKQNAKEQAFLTRGVMELKAHLFQIQEAEKHIETLKRKLLVEDQHKLKLQEDLKRWDMYRQERVKLIDKAVAMIKKQRHVIEFIVQNNLLIFVKAIFQNFQVLKERRLRKQSAIFLSKIFFIKYRAYYCRKVWGNEFDFRQVNLIRRHLSFMISAVLAAPFGNFKKILRKDTQRNLLQEIKKPPQQGFGQFDFQKSIISERAKKVIFWFLSYTQLVDYMKLCSKKSQASQAISNSVSKQIMSQLLRQKYVNKIFQDEGQFLVEFYRDSDNKRKGAKATAQRIEELFNAKKEIVAQKIQSYINIKSYEQRLGYNQYSRQTLRGLIKLNQGVKQSAIQKIAKLSYHLEKQGTSSNLNSSRNVPVQSSASTQSQRSSRGQKSVEKIGEMKEEINRFKQVLQSATMTEEQQEKQMASYIKNNTFLKQKISDLKDYLYQNSDLVEQDLLVSKSLYKQKKRLNILSAEDIEKAGKSSPALKNKKKKSVSPGLVMKANIQQKLGQGLLDLFKSNETEDSSGGGDDIIEAKRPSKFIVMPMKDEVQRIIMSSVYVAKKQSIIMKNK